MHLQLELQSRSLKWDGSSEREDYRARAMELNKREQALLQKEQEIDSYHEEANRLRLDAEKKQREAERLLLSKKKYTDELDDAKKEIANREAEITDLEKVKTGSLQIRF